MFFWLSYGLIVDYFLFLAIWLNWMGKEGGLYYLGKIILS
jgi:hypothetical protein